MTLNITQEDKWIISAARNGSRLALPRRRRRRRVIRIRVVRPRLRPLPPPPARAPFLPRVWRAAASSASEAARHRDNSSRHTLPVPRAVLSRASNLGTIFGPVLVVVGIRTRFPDRYAEEHNLPLDIDYESTFLFLLECTRSIRYDD